MKKMRKKIKYFLAFLICLNGFYSAFAQDCKPINIDGSSEAMVSNQRFNYLAVLPPRLTTIQEATIANTIKQLRFADYSADGCYVRAHVLSGQLAKAGITNIYKIWLLSPSHYTFFLNGFVKPKVGNGFWNYHVAVSFISSNGIQMIVDPAVDSQKAITYDEWLSNLQCSDGSLMMRTDRSRWLPATVTTQGKIPTQDYYGNDRNPFNGFIFSEDNDTPGMVSNHLSRDDVADKFKQCSSVSSLSSKDLFNKLTKGEAFDDCSGVLSYFKERQEHWKSIITKQP